MLFREMITVSYKPYTRPVNMYICEQNAELCRVKADGQHSSAPQDYHLDEPTGADTDNIALCLIHKLLNQLLHLSGFYYTTSIRGNFVFQ